MLVRLVPTPPSLPGSVKDVPRPRRHAPGFLGLWPRLRWPQTERGICLWQDGAVMLVESWEDAPEADDYIAGGHEWRGDDSSWQAQVLTAAGFTLEEVR